MNVHYFKELWKSSLMVLFLCLGLSSWGQETVTKYFYEYSFVQGDSGAALSGNIDSVISFTTESNSASTPTRYWGSGNSGHIRMYGHNSGNGGSITLYAANDAVITEVVFLGTGTMSAAKYFIDDNSSSTSVSAISNNYTISGIEATELKFQAASTGQVHIQGVQITYELAAPTGDHTITVIQPVGGEITPGTTGVDNGEDMSFTATAESSCYVFSHWVVDGVDAGNTNPYTFTNVTADHEITAVFNATASYEITATAGANGSINPSGTVEVNCGADQAFTITADSGYAVADVLVNGVSVGAVTTYTFENVTEDQAISASFVEYTGPCGNEDFETTDISNSYGDGSFTNNGITWTYGHSRNVFISENEEYSIDGNGILLRRASDSYLEVTIPDGVGEFSFDYRKAYTGNNSRQLELLINGVQVATSPTFGETPTGADATVYTFTHTVNVEGEVTVRIKLTGSATTNRHTTIDNISWTCYQTTPTAIIWTTSNVWSNGDGPTITDDVIIEGELAVGTDFGSFSAQTLTVEGSLTIEANASVTVEGKITNNGEFTVESDGILYQNNYTGVNEGAITVKRAANPMKRLDYTLWSSPVSGMLLNQFSNVSPNGGTGTIWNRVYELGADAWNPIWSSYENASTSTATFANAKGYLYRAFNSYDPTETTIFTGEFTGVPNNGEYSINTPNTFDAIGNPYPSPISADDFITSNNADAIYFWTNVNSSNGTEYVYNNWATYTTMGGAGVTEGLEGETEYFTPEGTIQPGQGFVVYTEEDSVSFDNSMRINSNGQFFRAMNDERSRFWLNLSNEEVTFNQILVGYMDNATQGVDTGIDGKMFAYEGNALYSIIDNNEDMFVIQGRALPFTASDVVALGFRAVNAGSFTISLHNFDGLFANNQNIYLKDNFTQLLHNLKEGAYTFVSEEGIFNTRFEVVYQTTMSVENPIANNANWIVYSQENGYQIQTQGFELKSVQVFDLLGRTIYTASAEGTAHHIPSLGADSVYIVKVTTTDNVVLSKKVK